MTKFLLGIFFLFICSVGYAEIVDGRVVGADLDGTVLVALPDGARVREGDAVEIVFKASGATEQASAGRGKIKKVMGDRVLVRMAPGAGRIQPGFHARIQTAGGRSSALSAPVKPANTGPVWLGIQTLDLNAGKMQKLGLKESSAASVVFYYPNSPAAKARLRQGDVLLSAGGEAVISGDNLLKLYQHYAPGQTMHLQVFRSGEGTLSVDAVAEKMPSEEEQSASIRQAAQSGDSLFQYVLGCAYLQNGKANPVHQSEGIKWLTLSAQQGQPEARAEIARLQFFDPSHPVNIAEAESWLRDAAGKGNGKAQYLLGLLYLQGQGIAKDESQAFLWLRRSAEAEYPEGMTSVGAMYENGLGVPKSVDSAVKWYKKGAASGEPTAKQNLQRLGRS